MNVVPSVSTNYDRDRLLPFQRLLPIRHRRLAEQRWQHSCPERTNNKGCRPNEIEGKEVGDLLFCTYWFSLVSRFRSTVALVSARHKLEPSALEPKWRPCTCKRLHVLAWLSLYCALYNHVYMQPVPCACKHCVAVLHVHKNEKSKS